MQTEEMCQGKKYVHLNIISDRLQFLKQIASATTYVSRNTFLEAWR